MTRDRASKIEHCSIYKNRDASRRIATLCDASQRIQCSHSLLFAYVLRKSTHRAVTRRNACSVAGPLLTQKHLLRDASVHSDISSTNISKSNTFNNYYIIHLHAKLAQILHEFRRSISFMSMCCLYNKYPAFWGGNRIYHMIQIWKDWTYFSLFTKVATKYMVTVHNMSI